MQHRVRAIWVMILLSFGYTIISLNLIEIQLVQHDKFWRMAVKNHLHPEVLAAKRGSILDREGNIMAQTQTATDVSFDGKLLANHVKDLAQVADVLQIPAAPLIASVDPRKRDVAISENVDDTVVAKLQALKINGLIFKPHDRRFYPNNELAAHVLGFLEEDAQKPLFGHGLAGMEKEMDASLSGIPGERWVECDGKSEEIAGYQTRTTPAIDGYDVTLTINMAIQHVIEDQLDQIVQTYQPNGAYIIVMDPHTGEILAMGSRPAFDPNDRKTFQKDAVRNRCITDMVEPGSIFKIITLAAALNEGEVNLNTPIFCENGAYSYAGKILKDDEKNGWLPVEEVLAKSSNIGFAKIALNYVGENKLYKYATDFGIGQRTGIFSQQDESAGLLRPLKKWSALSITRIPMGQEVGATPLQMATAMCVIANGGRLMVPQLAKQVTDSAGRLVKVFQPQTVRQVISPEAAQDVATALHQVTVDGTAKHIVIPGYSFAAKTGTAQKFVDGAYSHTKFVSSFLGFMPAEDPAFVALVMVDAPQTAKYYGADVSGPVFAAVAKQVAQIMNLVPDQPVTAPVLSSNNPPSL